MSGSSSQERITLASIWSWRAFTPGVLHALGVFSGRCGAAGGYNFRRSETLREATTTHMEMEKAKREGEPQNSSQQEISIKEFLETAPPGDTAAVKDMATKRTNASRRSYYELNLPMIELHCDSTFCAGLRLFEPITTRVSAPECSPGEWVRVYLSYRCRNCLQAHKTYAVAVYCPSPAPAGKTTNGVFYKYGERPPFGPPTPSRVITILGPEKDYYLKGRRAESQGMGLGAFAYYRRVVENQKNRLLDEIIRVAEQIGASAEMLDDLNRAKKEKQFALTVDRVKHGIPPALLVNGHHNPLTLLHKALSEGLHAQSDEECLASATSIRVVLADLADRLGHALKDRAELDTAVSKLLNR
jgi:hypothetical protein